MASKTVPQQTSAQWFSLIWAMLFSLSTQAQSCAEGPMIREWLENVPENTKIHFNEVSRLLDWHSGIGIDLIFDTPRPIRLSILIGSIDYAQPNDRAILQKEGRSAGVFLYRGKWNQRVELLQRDGRARERLKLLLRPLLNQSDDVQSVNARVLIELLEDLDGGEGWMRKKQWRYFHSVDEKSGKGRLQ